MGESYGIVINADNRQPVSGVEVSLRSNGSGALVNDIMSQTDSTGEFYLSGIEFDPADDTGKYFISIDDPSGKFHQDAIPMYGFGGTNEYETITLYPSELSVPSVPSWVWIILVAAIIFGVIYFSKTNKINSLW